MGLGAKPLVLNDDASHDVLAQCTFNRVGVVCAADMFLFDGEVINLIVKVTEC